MKGGRLKIVNESSFDAGEVETLVRFGLSEIDLTGHRLVVVVKRTRSDTGLSGSHYSLTRGIPTSLYNRYCGARTCTHQFAILRVGREGWPQASWRKFAGVPQREYRDWREGLVAVAAHEGMHAQHDHDDAYGAKSGWARRKVSYRIDGEEIERVRFVQRRVGVERIEPKCEAFENYMLRRYRESLSGQAEFATVGATALRESVVSPSEGVGLAC